MTVGQYLRPSAWNLPVVEYATPERFAALEKAGMEMGFTARLRGPLRPLELPRRGVS